MCLTYGGSTDLEIVKINLAFFVMFNPVHMNSVTKPNKKIVCRRFRPVLAKFPLLAPVKVRLFKEFLRYIFFKTSNRYISDKVANIKPIRRSNKRSEKNLSFKHIIDGLYSTNRFHKLQLIQLERSLFKVGRTESFKSAN